MTSTHTQASRDRVPLALRLLRIALRATAMFSTRLAGSWAHHLWYRTYRYPEPAREREWRDTAIRSALVHRGRPLAVYQWGEGETVLLVHGWHGRGLQLGGIGTALAAAGLRAVAFDAPAHGNSPGNATNLPEVSEALERVAAAYAPVRGVVAHSFGVPCSLYALSQSLRAERVVVLSAPASIEFLSDSFCTTLALPERVARDYRRRFEQRFGADLWQRFNPKRLAAALDLPALILHDLDDHEVPWEEGAELAAAWRGSVFEHVQGLGHRRILRDPEVIARVVRFLAERR